MTGRFITGRERSCGWKCCALPKCAVLAKQLSQGAHLPAQPTKCLGLLLCQLQTCIIYALSWSNGHVHQN